jgi:hypothetical protein
VPSPNLTSLEPDYDLEIIIIMRAKRDLHLELRIVYRESFQFPPRELFTVDVSKVTLKLSDKTHICNSIIGDGVVSKFHEGHGGSLLTSMPYVFWRILDFEITGKDFDLKNNPFFI